MSSEIEELLQFLQLGARSSIKEIALDQILSLTATDEGIKSLVEVPKVFLHLLMLLNDNNENIQKNSALSLVNLTTCSDCVQILLELNLQQERLILRSPDNIIKTCLMFISHKDSHIADECCMILSNITRESRYIEKVVDLLHESTVTLEKLANIFAKVDYNMKGGNLDHLGSIFLNLSQSERIRKEMIDRNSCIIQKLLPFIDYNDSMIRRRGIAGTLKNCTFETECHKWLLSEDVDVLPRILLPLADGTEFDEEVNDKLPVEVQFLPEDKQREKDAEIRLMLLESLNQLCALKENREYIREKNAYVILRELHKAESNSRVLLACERCVDILIRSEGEINVDNLKEVDIPVDIKEKLEKLEDINSN